MKRLKRGMDIEMNLAEFNVLYEVYKEGSVIYQNIVRNTGYESEQVSKVIEGLREKGWIESGITKKGYEELEQYRVDNAIIMAAGFGIRSLPLSRVVPKGLFEVKGEVLIERQIRQLKEAGIEQIIVVVGYLKEKFEYLKEKYQVILVENEDYYRYNNISSLYAAKEYLKRSYICCSDNYFGENVFADHVYDSYYACKYTEEYADEYCVTKMDGAYIQEIVKGGSNAWYTIGEAFFSAQFSEIFLNYLLKEYDEPGTKKMLMDDFHIRHINELKFRLVKYTDEILQEFDTITDVIAFDPQFVKYRDRLLAEGMGKPEKMPALFGKYEEIERYHSAITDQHTGRLHLNENAFGPSPKCLEVLHTVKRQDLYEYDMATKDFLTEEISRQLSIPEDDIYIHNGSAEVIKSVFSIMLERGDCILMPDPGWTYYSSLAREKFCDVYHYQVLKDDYTYYMDVEDILLKAGQYHPRIIVITTPHNPTGCRLDGRAIEMIVKRNPDSLVLLDQAYWGFSEEDVDVRRLVETYPNILISRTFSKYYGLANMRVGFGFCNVKVKHIFGLDLPLFRESVISRRMAAAALRDKAYYEEMNREMCRVKTWFMDTLNRVPGIRVFQSDSNFVAVRVENKDLRDLRDVLQENNLLIRLFEDHGEPVARIAIGLREEMEKTAGIIEAFVKGVKEKEIC